MISIDIETSQPSTASVPVLGIQMFDCTLLRPDRYAQVARWSLKGEEYKYFLYVTSKLLYRACGRGRELQTSFVRCLILERLQALVECPLPPCGCPCSSREQAKVVLSRCDALYILEKTGQKLPKFSHVIDTHSFERMCHCSTAIGQKRRIPDLECRNLVADTQLQALCKLWRRGD
jgi:hypothetical protein